MPENPMSKIKKLIKKYKINLIQLKIFAMFFLTVILILNIAASQLVSPLYFDFVDGKREASIAFLQQIRSLTVFDNELKKQQIRYDKTIIDDVFREENEKIEQIKYFEQILDKNPYSRDILYSLYRLHLESGNTIMANFYFKKAQFVDPDIAY